MKKVSKILKTFIVCFCMALTMTACSSSDDSSSQADASDNDDKTLVVGFDQNFPPFGYVDDDGNYVGFDIDLAKEAAKRMDMKIKLQPIDWDSKDMELDSGTIDCIWNGFTINGREKQYTWTDPYMDNSQVVVVRTDSGINTLSDLKGKNVEAQKESSADTALSENKKLKKSFGNYTTVADYNTGIMDLESGAADAVAMDIYVAQDQIAGKDNMKILDEKISSEQYAVGFKKGNTELRDKVQKALQEMVKDGTFQEISEKWFDGQNVCILDAGE
ncbi:amino acid ABC transporter substrate-binding protein [Catenisphaera adipataccumulans]|jgi:polar amino acid transport system substrate-binding protein|uniref:Polar amino acid transport system substrate-binding protein n=1 Tax=Catenisphaera adipataccumulans TaxID=700500 RepID=A0A7W8D031_9FIRM|nr:amino acid ABC transporter substrate-binding protein [Catenisphaera adipataccumulans]MBB5183633.1 polar amino acid transport system substrate-binding protein [Catenisphaera adipataccumulans]